MIIERVGGAPYYEQLRERILYPHSLSRTVPSDTRLLPIVQGYAGAGWDTKTRQSRTPGAA